MYKCMLTNKSFTDVASYCDEVGLTTSSFYSMMDGLTRNMSFVIKANSFGDAALLKRIIQINALSRSRAIVDTSTGRVWKSMAALLEDGISYDHKTMVKITDMLKERGLYDDPEIVPKKKSGRPSRSVVNKETGEVIDSITELADVLGCSIGHIHNKLSVGSYLGWSFSDTEF